MPATAQGTVTFSLIRNMGIGLGSNISGTFTLHGSGPDTVDNLTVYFNDVEVHFVNGNSVSWQFDTGNYEAGATNITLVGITSTGETLSASVVRVFMSEGISSIFTIGMIALVVVLILVRYVPRFMSARNK
jgi:hypothetical protein